MTKNEYTDEDDDEYKDSKIIILGPPLAIFPQQPKDQSKSTVVDCPECGERMWLSIVKKKIIKGMGMENVRLLCFDCMTRLVLSTKESCS